MLPESPTSSDRQDAPHSYRAPTGSAAPLDPSLDPAMLQVHAQLYAAEYAAHWGRYNTQLVANVGLLAAITIASPNVFVHAHLHVITILGAEVSAIWLLLSIASARRVSSVGEALSRAAGARVAAHATGAAMFGRYRSTLNRLSWTLPTLAVLGWLLLFFSKSNL